MSNDVAVGAETALSRTCLYDLHVELGAKMVPFAGYEMPVQYPMGIMKEHLHTRTYAGLFDVSHMGQAMLAGKDAVRVLESLVPGDIEILKPSRMRYTMLTNDQGTIIDDLMVTKMDDGYLLVLNAGCKHTDMAHITKHLSGDATITLMEDRALLALQGPRAVDVLAQFIPGVGSMKFMTAQRVEVCGGDCYVSRSGYTGEDGFEISVPNSIAEAFAKRLLKSPETAPIGLGARDTLRLEAGLCLYGHDIDLDTSPIEAGLNWTISKRRRSAGGFPGFDRIGKELEHGPARKRVGILPDGRAPARDGTEIVATDGRVIGTITSGGFGPTLGGPIAMGYVEAEFTAQDTPLLLRVRGRDVAARVVALPFVEHHYFKA